MSGWSNAEARTATWMSYDTRIQNLLPKDLKKPDMERSKKFLQNNRLFNQDINAVHLMTTFLFLKESVKTSLQMSTATSIFGGCQISKCVGKLVRHEYGRDREAHGPIHWGLIRRKLKFTFTRQGGDTFH